MGNFLDSTNIVKPKGLFLDSQGLFSYILSLPDLVAYYPLNETSGDAINQAPATKGTLNGTITGATQGVAGQVGRAYSFDGVNDQITMDLWAAVNTNITMGTICKTNDLAEGRQSIISNGGGSGGNRGYSLVINGGVTPTTDGSLFILDHFVKWVDTGYNWPDTNFHIVDLVLNSSGFPSIFVDGIQKYSSGSVTFSSANTTSAIGMDLGLGFMNGKIQHAYILNQALANGNRLKIARIARLA